jgi:hypothetical protein
MFITKIIAILFTLIILFNLYIDLQSDSKNIGLSILKLMEIIRIHKKKIDILIFCLIMILYNLLLFID